MIFSSRACIFFLCVGVGVGVGVGMGVGGCAWSWSALQFALQDLKIALANTPSVHPLFVLYCIVYYKRERESVCVCGRMRAHVSCK